MSSCRIGIWGGSDLVAWNDGHGPAGCNTPFLFLRFGSSGFRFSLCCQLFGRGRCGTQCISQPQTEVIHKIYGLTAPLSQAAYQLGLVLVEGVLIHHPLFGGITLLAFAINVAHFAHLQAAKLGFAVDEELIEDAGAVEREGCRREDDPLIADTYYMPLFGVLQHDAAVVLILLQSGRHPAYYAVEHLLSVHARDTVLFTEHHLAVHLGHGTSQILAVVGLCLQAGASHQEPQTETETVNHSFCIHIILSF